MKDRMVADSLFALHQEAKNLTFCSSINNPSISRPDFPSHNPVDGFSLQKNERKVRCFVCDTIFFHHGDTTFSWRRLQKNVTVS